MLPPLLLLPLRSCMPAGAAAAGLALEADEGAGNMLDVEEAPKPPASTPVEAEACVRAGEKAGMVPLGPLEGGLPPSVPSGLPQSAPPGMTESP